MTEMPLTTVEIEPKGAARSSVIWMHGLGADARDFEPIVPELHLPDGLDIRFVFPNAPIRFFFFFDPTGHGQRWNADAGLV